MTDEGGFVKVKLFENRRLRPDHLLPLQICEFSYICVHKYTKVGEAKQTLFSSAPTSHRIRNSNLAQDDLQIQSRL